jgi:DNA helicase-2/ATP-dependent DNA helicase PcrA
MSISTSGGGMAALFKDAGFTPNAEQLSAILHDEGPLHIVAGPGSGKTRVLLWRVVHLIVERGVAPGDIFLATFSEKAARQLREGVAIRIEQAAEATKQRYDLSEMYVGTVHSLCQRILEDRDFRPPGTPLRVPAILDEQGQYDFISTSRFWSESARSLGKTEDALLNEIRWFLVGRHQEERDRLPPRGKKQLLDIFNRLSEETFDLDARIACAGEEHRLIYRLYGCYRGQLAGQNRVDYATLQHAALAQLEVAEQARPGSARSRFKHILIDEYQDTNSIQEALVFRLAEGHKNLAVVGDDDQALYRFRGATVENFVRFPERAHTRLGVAANRIQLTTNYRSVGGITEGYREFMDAQDWQAAGQTWRVENKQVKAHRPPVGPQVVSAPKGNAVQTATLFAAAVRRLIHDGKVSDPNEVAFLFPSVQGKTAEKYRAALEAEGIEVYAPRMEPLLFSDEATQMLGIMHQVVGHLEQRQTWTALKPSASADKSESDWDKFQDWLVRADRYGKMQVQAEPAVAAIVERRLADLRRLDTDYTVIDAWLAQKGLDRAATFETQHARALARIPGLSEEALKGLRPHELIAYAARLRRMEQTPTIGRVVARATTGDWTLLDLFYEVLGTPNFEAMLDAAQGRKKEAPVANLAQLSRLIDRFMTTKGPFMRGQQDRDRFRGSWYNGFLYPNVVMRETLDEDELVAFPRGSVPFLTIHQSKGLEFPVVVVPKLSPNRTDHRQKNKLAFLQAFLDWKAAALRGAEAREPTDASKRFDAMRLFYVAMSRAENLLILGKAPTKTAKHADEGNAEGQNLHKQFAPVFKRAKKLGQLSLLDSVPDAKPSTSGSVRTYSFTADFLAYRRCARHYMLFRQFGFIETRAQTMFFGSLVHATIEEFHRRLIHARRSA